MLRAAKTVTTVRGKKIQTWKPEADGKEAVLKQAMGPSGNLRAPTIRVKDRFIIGFNPEAYKEWPGFNGE